MSFVIDRLESMPSVEERIKEADFLAKRMEGTGYIPCGEINPPFFAMDQPKKEDIPGFLDEHAKFYEQVRALCGGTLPPNMAELFERFQKNKAHSLDIMRHASAWDISMSEYFPFWNNFDEKVHEIFAHSTSEVDIASLKFTPELLGQGGFGEVYRVSGDRDYALKLFYPWFRFHPDSRHSHGKVVDFIAKNLKEQKDSFAGHPFVPIRAITYYDHFRDTQFAYLMDYFEGEDVSKLVEKKDPILKKSDVKGQILLTYAQMLKQLHASGRIFVDNSLSAILLGKEDCRIIDVDLITPVEGLEGGFLPYHASYVPREMLIGKAPNYHSELESFALMVHHLLIKQPFLDPDWQLQHENKKKAEANNRRYYADFRRRLPKSLRQVVAPLIAYPRDDSITIDDFIRAIKEDFRV